MKAFLLFLAILFVSFNADATTVEELKRENELLKLRLQLLEKQVNKLLNQSKDNKRVNIPQVKAKKNSNINGKFYGFIRVDMAYDSSRTLNGNSYYYILERDKERFILTPRSTRFGYKFYKQAYGNFPAIDGKIEMDFFGGGNEDKAQLRLRHAYLKLNYKNYSWLIGQTWDLFSSLNPYVADFGTLYYAGNLGFRIAQLRYTRNYKLSERVSTDFGIAFARPYRDNTDLDIDGIDDGEHSGMPDIQLRFGYKRKYSKNRVATLAISGVMGKDKLSTPINGEDEFEVSGICIEQTFKFNERFSFKGEYYEGKNIMSYAGAVGYGVNTRYGDRIYGFGGWGQLFYKLPSGNLWTVGYGMDANKLDQLKTYQDRFRHKNMRWFTNYTIKLRKDVKMILDISRMFTEYYDANSTNGLLLNREKFDNWRTQINFIWFF